MIHVVFQANDAEVLRKSFELEGSVQGDVIRIGDDFALGPLMGIYTPEGIETRKQWWRAVLTGGEQEGPAEDATGPDDQKTVAGLVERLREDPQEVCWIWAAQNKHDVSGYYWLMSQLRDFQGRVFILYLNNLPFINEKGQLFYPVNLHDIPAREFLKARKLARQVTLSEFEIDPDEWFRLCNEDKGVRILEGGKKLVQYDYDYYDEDLKKFITGDWIKAGKLIHQFLTKSRNTAGEAYVLWRLKWLAQTGQIDTQGELKGVKDFEVKSKTAQTANDAMPA
ncbi:MAG: DUF1835 domain-containing protein [Puia sp.]|nr:DUF1835 domain-containing protein [Puia sp.]